MGGRWECGVCIGTAPNHKPEHVTCSGVWRAAPFASSPHPSAIGPPPPARLREEGRTREKRGGHTKATHRHMHSARSHKHDPKNGVSMRGHPDR
eukprot:scaffold8843_cov185-Isochrysis_galbana.AAC.1